MRESGHQVSDAHQTWVSPPVVSTQTTELSVTAAERMDSSESWANESGIYVFPYTHLDEKMPLTCGILVKEHPS